MELAVLQEQVVHQVHREHLVQAELQEARAHQELVVLQTFSTMLTTGLLQLQETQVSFKRKQMQPLMVQL